MSRLKLLWLRFKAHCLKKVAKCFPITLKGLYLFSYIARKYINLEEIDEMFQSKIRNNDIIGIGNDQNIYLLAAQVDASSEGIVLKRFRDMGLKCDIVHSVS